MAEMQILTDDIEIGQNFLCAGVQYEVIKAVPNDYDGIVITARPDLTPSAESITLIVPVRHGFELVPPRNLRKENHGA